MYAIAMMPNWEFAFAACEIDGIHAVGQSVGGIDLGEHQVFPFHPKELRVINCTLDGTVAASSGSIGLNLDIPGFYCDVTSNTIVGWSTGIRMVGMVSPYLGGVRNNIVAQSGSVGVLQIGGSIPIYCNDVFQRPGEGTAFSGVPSPGGNITADPLFCGANPADPFALRVDSPAAPGNFVPAFLCADRMGARPVGCMDGTLTRTCGVPDDAAIMMYGDTLIPAGRSLTIGSGCTITTMGADVHHGGVDPDRCELTVEGELNVDGSSESPVMMLSSGGQPGTWQGVTVQNGGSVALHWTTIRDGVFGVYAADCAERVECDHCAISNVVNACIQVLNADCPTTDLIVTGGTCGIGAPALAYAGIYASGMRSAFIDGVTVTGRATATYGIYVGEAALYGTDADVWEARVSDFPAGSGLFVASGSATFRGCQVSGCKFGVNFQGSGTPCLVNLSAPGRSATTSISDCTTGAYVNSSGKPFMTGASIIAGTSTGIIGLYTEGPCTGYYRNLTISGGQTAIKANSQGPDSLFRSCVTGFASVGIQATATGQMVVGGSLDMGNNIYSALSGVTKYVTAKGPRTPGLSDVNAQYNWWGETPAPSAKFSSHVNYSNALTSTVSCSPGTNPFILGRDVPLKRMFAVYPNPSTNQVAMSFTVPQGLRTEVDLRVFDVSGRLVRTLVSEALDPGDHDAVWDGRDASGVQAAAGLYFAQLRLGLEIHTHKLMRLPR